MLWFDKKSISSEYIMPSPTWNNNIFSTPLLFTEYGEFKTLVAQESDWLERLEKKLRKSSSNTAADAEEISEELNAIENFLDNHPEDRLRRIRTLAESLTKKNILISTWLDDAKRLEERWGELKKRAKYVFMRVLFLKLPPSMIYF